MILELHLISIDLHVELSWSIIFSYPNIMSFNRRKCLNLIRKFNPQLSQSHLLNRMIHLSSPLETPTSFQFSPFIFHQSFCFSKKLKWLFLLMITMTQFLFLTLQHIPLGPKLNPQKRKKDQTPWNYLLLPTRNKHADQ